MQWKWGMNTSSAKWVPKSWAPSNPFSFLLLALLEPQPNWTWNVKPSEWCRGKQSYRTGGVLHMMKVELMHIMMEVWHSAMLVRMTYRVTIQVLSNIPLTSKQKFCFSMKRQSRLVTSFHHTFEVPAPGSWLAVRNLQCTIGLPWDPDKIVTISDICHKAIWTITPGNFIKVKVVKKFSISDTLYRNVG